MAAGSDDSVSWTLNERLELTRDVTEIKAGQVGIGNTLKRIEEGQKKVTDRFYRQIETQEEKCDERHGKCDRTYTAVQRQKAVIGAAIVLCGLMLGLLKYLV